MGVKDSRGGGAKERVGGGGARASRGVEMS